MKKFLLLFTFLFTVFGFAQNPILLNNSWVITKISYQNSEYTIPVPVIAPEIHGNLTTFTTTKFETKLVNTSIGNISSITNNQIIITGMGGTLAQSPNTDFALFEENYRNIFSLASLPKTLDYIIKDLGNGNYTLIFSDTITGNKVYFQNIINPLNNLLIDNTWLISNLKIGNNIYTPTLTEKKIKFTATNANINYFNNLSGYIYYNSQISQFNLSNSYVSMADSFNALIAEFDGNYLENFWGIRIPNNLNYISPKNPFNYNISPDGKTLTITNSNGDIATYNKEILSTQEIQKNNLKLYPNPVSDFITIENLKTNSSIKILDTSGKIVLNKKLLGNFIDVKSLPKGIYFIQIEGERPLKFIKK